VAVTAVAGIGIAGTFAAGSDVFSSTTTNEGNQFATGTVVITDDDAGKALFELPFMTPSTVVERCINVANGGTSPFDQVAMTNHPEGDLAPHIGLKVEWGTGADGGPGHDCTGFVKEGELFDERLDARDKWFQPGLSPGQVRSYRFTVTLAEPQGAEGKSAATEFGFHGRAF
jgi:hypothetical protein